MRSHLFYKHTWWLVGIVLSLLATVWHLHYQQPINPDGILYLKAASAYWQHGLFAAMAIYPWPLYSILIALIAHSLNCSLLTAAHGLDALFDAATVILVAQFAYVLTGEKLVRLWVLVLIFLLPNFNHLRDVVIRDHGYYPFALLAFMALWQLQKKQQMRYALAFGLLMALATLFRIEGSAFLLLLPLYFLALTREFALGQRIHLMLQAYGVPIILVLTILVWHLLHPAPNTAHLGRLHYASQQISDAFAVVADRFLLVTSQLKPLMMEASRSQINAFLIAGLFGLLFHGVFTATSVVFLVLGCLALRYLPWRDHLFLYTLLAVNIAIVVLFVSERIFLEARYVALFAILWLIPVAILLVELQQRLQARLPLWNELTPKQTVGVVIIFTLGLTYNFAASFGHWGLSKAYLVQAGRWLAQKNVPSKQIYSNNEQLAFYADAKTTVPVQCQVQPLTAMLTCVHWQQFRYIVLQISKKESGQLPALAQLLGGAPIYQTHNRRGDQAVVFKIKSP